MEAREQQKSLFTGRWRSVSIAAPKEVELQIQFVSMMKWALRPDVLMFQCPNGGLRENKREAAKLRAMGVRPGVSDLVFCWSKPLLGWPDGKQFRALRLRRWACAA